MRSLPAVAHRDDVVLGDDLVENEADVRERLPQGPDAMLHALPAGPLARDRIVLDEVVGDAVVEELQPAAVQDLVEQHPNDGLEC